MNCIFKRVIALFFTFCIIFSCVACSSKLDSSETSQISSKNHDVEFYKDNGYYELSTSDYLNFDIIETSVVVVDGTTLIKKGTIIYATAIRLFSISENLRASSSSKYSNYDFENQQILTGFKINGKFYSYDNFDNFGIKMSCDIEIEPVFESFELKGFCIHYVNEDNQNAELFLEDDGNYLKENVVFSENSIETKDELAYYLYYAGEEELKNDDLTNIQKNINCDIEIQDEKTQYRIMLPNVGEAEFKIYLMALDENGETIFILLGEAESEDGTTKYFDFSDEISKIYGLGNKYFSFIDDPYVYGNYYK